MELLGDANDPDYSMSKEMEGLFTALGFPKPNPVPLMALHFQIAQKLHCASEEGSERAHDLVDLQIAVTEGKIDLTKTRTTCERLFAYRKQQPWPPIITVNPQWPELYDAAKRNLSVLPSVEAAVVWTNELIGANWTLCLFLHTR